MINFERCEKPDAFVVKHFANSFDVVYHKTEEELITLFKRQPITETLIIDRVKKLNSYYHTRLSGNQKKAIRQFILNEGDRFEELIRTGSDREKVVSKIALCGSQIEYSFATKYCSFVNPDLYPIYDNNVAKALSRYKERFGFHKDDCFRFETIRKKCRYESFVNIIDDFIEFFRISKKECSYKEVDKFLWLVGSNL